MATRVSKRYAQYCGLARALDVLGERWSLLIVRELMLGERRFTELQGALRGLTANLLALRLRELAKSGILTKSSGGYVLTEVGRELEAPLLALGRWGFAHSERSPRPDEVVNIGWGLFSLTRRYRGGVDLLTEWLVHNATPQRGGEPVGPLVDRRFALLLTPASMRVEERALDHPVDRPDLALSGALTAYQSWLFRGTPVSALVSKGEIQVAGPAEAWEQLQSAFHGAR